MKYFITGTTSGIGEAIKKRLSSHEVFEINRADVDLNTPELINSIKLPTVDYAILNAGHDLGGGVPFTEHDPSSIQKILNCNLISNVLLTQKLLQNNTNTIGIINIPPNKNIGFIIGSFSL